MTESHKDFIFEMSRLVSDTDFLVYYKALPILFICGSDFISDVAGCSGCNLVIPCNEIKVIGVDEY